jgi:pre-rRNA-processing protein TSR1
MFITGKIESGQRQTRHQQVMSKLNRRNQARQKQRLKRHQHAQADTIFTGRDAVPKRVVVVPLCAEVDAPAAVSSLNASLDIEAAGAGAAPATSPVVTVDVERFKRKLQYVVVRRQLTSVLDGCRVADFVLFVLSAAGEIDAVGERLLRAIEGQGVTNVVSVIQVRFCMLWGCFKAMSGS